MISALILAALLGQTTQATARQVAGATKVLRDAMKDVIDGTRTPTRFNGRDTACILPLTTIPGGSVTLRFGQAVATPRGQNKLGMGAPLTAGGWDDATDMYVTIEVQTTEQAQRVRDIKEIDLWDGPDPDVVPESRILTAPSQPTCEVAIRRKGATGMGFRCACVVTVGSTCTWINPDTIANPGGTRTNAPVHRTLPAESNWTGAGCMEKPCLTRARGGVDETWPVECP